MEGTVTGFCLKTDGGVSYLACPFCYAHLCPSYHQFQASNNYSKLMIDVDSGGSSSSGSEQLLDDDFLYNCLRSIAGQPYRQLNTTTHPRPCTPGASCRQNWTRASSGAVGGQAWDTFSAVCWLYGRGKYTRLYPW